MCVKEMGPAVHWGDEDMEKSPQCPSYSIPVEGLGGGEGRVSARYLEGYCFLGIFTF